MTSSATPTVLTTSALTNNAFRGSTLASELLASLCALRFLVAASPEFPHD